MPDNGRPGDTRGMPENEPPERIRELEAAVRDLYNAAVEVCDITNPNLKPARQHLSRLLDRYEALVTAIERDDANAR